MNLEGVCVAPARAPGSNPNRLGQSKLSTVHREEVPMGMWGWGGEGVLLQKYRERRETALGPTGEKESGDLGF